MHDFLITLLAQAQSPAAGAAGEAPGGALMGFLPIVFMIAIFYFLLIRPQQKKQKEHERLVGGLKSGDKVVLIGGEHGIVTNVKEKTVLIRIAENTKVEYEKSAVSTVVKSETAEPAPAK